VVGDDTLQFAVHNATKADATVLIGLLTRPQLFTRHSEKDDRHPVVQSRSSSLEVNARGSAGLVLQTKNHCELYAAHLNHAFLVDYPALDSLYCSGDGEDMVAGGCKVFAMPSPASRDVHNVIIGIVVSS
jgi:hypothetical protein